MPSSSPAPPSTRSIAARISAGSAMRPTPVSPSASRPELGPTTAAPRAASVAMFACVAGECHITWFIAGASSSGRSVASSTVEARSSAMPSAALVTRSAVAGATTTRSQSRARRIWPISCSSVSEKRSVKARSRDSVATESGVTNSCAARVRMQRTEAPRSRRRRISSRLL